jgi:hypothetical protein
VAIELALAEVRANDVLAAWFTLDSSATASDLAARIGIVTEVIDLFLADLWVEAAASPGSTPRPTWRYPTGRARAADLVVRVVLSLLARPAPDEHRLLAELLVPALFEV